MTVSDARIPGSPHALILGLGESGMAAAHWYVRMGWRVRVADTRTQPPVDDLQRAALTQAGCELRVGMSTFETALLEEISEVLISPGLSPRNPTVSDLLQEAKARDIPVVGEIELFARALDQLQREREYAPAVLAITGTNGKTTVTALTTHMLNAAGVRACAAGNIGPAALHALQTALDDDALPDAWVLELSSFQLETTHNLRPHAAAVLNISEDHVDWHGGLDNYITAKRQIFNHAQLAIVNRSDVQVAAMVDDIAGLQVRSFGIDLPILEGDLGLDSTQGLVWLAEAAATDFEEPAAGRRRRKNDPPPIRAEGRLNRLMPADALQIRGVHNSLNAQAALLLARSLDLPWAPLLRTLREYRGEPHRVAWVRTVGEVDFIDDSKGTNVGATLAALQGLGRRVVLIAGGLGKGQDFSVLAPAVAQHARAVVLLGQDADIIERALVGTGVPCVRAASLPEAVQEAARHAHTGDAVLLSPACASHDMFNDYRHRAAAFVAAVDELALERGEV